MPNGRRKVLLAKLKTARGADVPSSGPAPPARSLSRLNSSGRDFDDDEPLAVFGSPTPAYGAAVGGTRGLRLSLGEPPGTRGLPALNTAPASTQGGTPSPQMRVPSLDTRVPSLDTLPRFKVDAQRDSMDISNARLRKKKNEVRDSTAVLNDNVVLSTTFPTGGGGAGGMHVHTR